MKITAILAMTNDCLIGNNNSLLWHIPEDMEHFKNITMNNVVVMGKNTYFSLPEKYRPLPNRRNIVFTSGSIPGVECVKNFSEFKKIIVNENRKIFLIGGAQLYNYFFSNSYINEVELTIIEGGYKGNVFVDEFRQNFIEKSRKKFKSGYFITLIKK